MADVNGVYEDTLSAAQGLPLRAAVQNSPARDKTTRVKSLLPLLALALVTLMGLTFAWLLLLVTICIAFAAALLGFLAYLRRSRAQSKIANCSFEGPIRLI
jgi:hypothetical protein